MRLRRKARKLTADLLSWSRAATVSVVCTVTVCAAAYGAYAAVWPVIVEHSYFRLRSVKVTCDSAVAEPAVLASRAGLFEGTSLWKVDVERASAALAAAPWVRSVRIARRFPTHVSVEVLRREPIAATLTDAGAFLIDSDGIIYREEGAIPYADLPYLTGWNDTDSRIEQVARLRTSMALTDAAGRNGVVLSEVHIDEQGIYWLYPQTHRIAVRLGTTPDAELSLQRLAAVLTSFPRQTTDVDELDMSYPDRAVVRVAAGRLKRVVPVFASSRAAARAEVDDRG